MQANPSGPKFAYLAHEIPKATGYPSTLRMCEVIRRGSKAVMHALVIEQAMGPSAEDGARMVVVTDHLAIPRARALAGTSLDRLVADGAARVITTEAETIALLREYGLAG